MRYGNPHIVDARKLDDNCTVALLVKDIQGGLHELEVIDGDLFNYQQGGLIQNSFPYLDAGQRELMITGFTAKMWDEMYDDKED